MLAGFIVTYVIFFIVSQFLYWVFIWDFYDSPWENFDFWKKAKKRREAAKNALLKTEYQKACDSEKEAAQHFLLSTGLLIGTFFWPLFLVAAFMWIAWCAVYALWTVAKNSGSLLASAIGKFED
jgi:hypothetical protein